uniref:NADH-ubiquinone oxidoreductase chain 4L n=1 Tax=Sakuraeolis japonica TaxID=1939669 RepID=A0A343AZG8_9GAST|nr:NADH dehydrogenase subunit 4L [Sakuraeolis japonica]APZ75717.1 NADH dehydrogenase subunit 4L [Sakuraeolis japonica]
MGVISSLFSYAKLNVRVLSVLISLEGLMLSLLLLFFSSLTLMGTSKHFFLVLLTFAACEAALGLSLLVSVIRLRSNDYVASLSSLNF